VVSTMCGTIDVAKKIVESTGGLSEERERKTRIIRQPVRSYLSIRAHSQHVFRIIFNGSIDHTPPSLLSGQDCYLIDSNGQKLARGFYNSYSLYSLRLLIRATEHPDLFHAPLTHLLKTRIINAFNLRKLLHLPNPSTTVYRLINGEGDGLSGLVVDVIDQFLIVQSSAIWCEVHRATLESHLLETLSSTISSPKVIWTLMKSRLVADGWTNLEEESVVSSKTTSSISAVSSASSQIVIRENGLQFHVTPGEGQKTGFYCDQRDNRALIKTLSTGPSSFSSPLIVSHSSLSQAWTYWISTLGVVASLSMLSLEEPRASPSSSPHNLPFGPFNRTSL
jgi:23S rRNA G2069 N7-methylase RlmK/C1962 C5-methylase RlmI